VDGTVYILQKDFLLNLEDGKYAKLTAALLLAHDDKSTAATGGHGAPAPPEGYGAMTQEGVVRAVITDNITNVASSDLVDGKHRLELQHKILKDLRKKTDVKVEEVLFPDLTVQ
jgi:flagellar FliL protein